MYQVKLVNREIQESPMFYGLKADEIFSVEDFIPI